METRECNKFMVIGFELWMVFCVHSVECIFCYIYVCEKQLKLKLEKWILQAQKPYCNVLHFMFNSVVCSCGKGW